ncbi:methyl-accepting chemotaxis protein [Azospirillum sp. sgz302134]
MTLGKLSLTGKLLLMTSAVVVISVGIGTAIMTRWSADQARSAVMSEGQQLGYRHAAEVERQLGTIMTVAEDVREAILSAQRSGTATREHVNQLLRDTLAAHSDYLGVWAGFEPRALDNRDSEYVGAQGSDKTGRFLSYWNRGSGDIVLETLEDYDKDGAGDYYLLPKKTKAPVIVEPYMYKVSGKDVMITSIAVPILQDGRFLGVAGIDVALDRMSERLQTIRPFGNGAVALISNAGRWVAYQKADLLGKPIDEADPGLTEAKKAVQEGRFYSTEIFSRVLNAQVLRLAVPVRVGETKTPWSLLVGLPLTKAEENAAAIRNSLIGGSAIFLVALMATLGGVLLVLVRRPLGRTITVIEAMAAGNYDVTVPEQSRGDEIGRINQTLQQFKENARKVADLQHQQEEAARRAEVERRNSMLRVADSFEASVLGVVEIVASAATEMQSAATTLTATAEQTNQQAQSVAAGSNQAASNVQTVAAATEQLSASISEVTKQMAQSSAIAGRAVTDAQRTDETILSLVEAVERISKVIDLINNIAGQTNLLALNATIEAARAGEAGKGFAVVASEVKSLANQTAKATEEIAAEIAQVQSVTEQAVQAIKVIGGTITDMSAITGTVASAAEEQAAATAEITRNLQEAARGTQDVSGHITGVSQGAGETGAAASQVLSAADQLGRHAETLRGEVNRFLAEIRAA